MFIVEAVLENTEYKKELEASWQTLQNPCAKSSCTANSNTKPQVSPAWRSKKSLVCSHGPLLGKQLRHQALDERTGLLIAAQSPLRPSQASEASLSIRMTLGLSSEYCEGFKVNLLQTLTRPQAQRDICLFFHQSIQRSTGKCF